MPNRCNPLPLHATPRPSVLAFGVLTAAALQLSGPTFAQDAVRGWGSYRFDTDAYTVPAIDIVAHGTATAVLRTDGRIFVHGYTRLPEGPPAPASTSYLRIGITAATPTDHQGFGLLSDGTIASWGIRGAGLPVPALPAGTAYVQMSVGSNHAIAVRSDGAAVAWGSNHSGQAQVPALSPGLTVLQAHAGAQWSLLLLSNGAIVVFGNNNNGLMAVPLLPSGVTYTEVWGGPTHAIARRSDGACVGWGENGAGQADVPALPAGVTYTAMSLGSNHTLALRSDGLVVAWGNNAAGQCTVPLLPPGSAVQVAAGLHHSLARLANGSVVSWGNTSFELPTPTLTAGRRWQRAASGGPTMLLDSAGAIVLLGNPSMAVPQPPPGLSYTDVIAGTGHAVALRSDGRAIAWGDNNAGQCAIPPLPPGMRYTAADASFGRTVLLRSDGFAAECGAYGNHNVPPPPPGNPYVQVSCHWFGTNLLRSDGTVLVVNSNSANHGSVPALPPGLRYVSVARMRGFSAALRSDGEVITWGSAPAQRLPALPPGVVYVEIDGGEDELVARRSDGHIAGAAAASSSPFPEVPAPGPGESFVQVSVGNGNGVARVGPVCTYVTFASGCAGTRGISRLVPRDTPRIGAMHEITVFELPVDAALLVVGWNRTTPQPLASLGLPGCFQHVQADAVMFLAGTDAQVQLRIAIPNLLALVGAAFHHQAVVLDPAANAASAVVSDAAAAVIGRG